MSGMKVIGEKSKGRVIIFEEPMHYWMEEPLEKRRLKIEPLYGVQSSVELGRFGRLWGYRPKKGYLDKKKRPPEGIQPNSVPKELRNLEFHMNFKDGKPRGRGRTTPLRLK
ncbi:hypothetical protein H5410_028886 [Solanum commersonii]|uniref:Uncharacterized protein n=1 Tax=Solanum commersonii TaxID=4109 RepID=A0A9J5Z3Y4_SOLCO|nr:hypothetical protein H5410_028886 [Solanum commersonii]